MQYLKNSCRICFWFSSIIWKSLGYFSKIIFQIPLKIQSSCIWNFTDSIGGDLLTLNNFLAEVFFLFHEEFEKFFSYIIPRPEYGRGVEERKCYFIEAKKEMLSGKITQPWVKAKGQPKFEFKELIFFFLVIQFLRKVDTFITLQGFSGEALKTLNNFPFLSSFLGFFILFRFRKTPRYTYV